MPSQGSIPAVIPATDPPADAAPPRVALLGNPNTGKTTLFNRLSGLRHKTSNFPGTTLEARVGRLRSPLASSSSHLPTSSPAHPSSSSASPRPPVPSSASALDLIDLPGIYSLELDQAEAQICRDVLSGRAAPLGESVGEPQALLIVVDSTNLARNLLLVGEALRRRLPTVIALNMIDLARRRGIHVDPAILAARLGCDAIAVSARTGEGLDALRTALADPRLPNHTPPGDVDGLRAWADDLAAAVAAGHHTDDPLTDRADRLLTHPILGTLAFAIIMASLFWLLFSIAQHPMGWIDSAFAVLADAVASIMPDGVLRDLISQGIIGGVGATVVFLPQIALLFFCIALLEDTGYLARAAFVMDRLLRPFGLPGHSFVPLLSSHACALPGIMATRAIPDRRERLATILVAPFMTCSARLPVYILITTVLFRDRPALAALAFVGCYALGIVAGVLSALLARRTILRGKSRPMALELPTYKAPSVRTAALTTYDRSFIFLKKAGTNILAICIVLWWLSAYPTTPPPQRAIDLRNAAALAVPPPSEPHAEQPFLEGLGNQPIGDFPAFKNVYAQSREDLFAEAARLEHAHAAAHSFAGRMGRFIQPALAPIGCDWQLSVAVLTSFAAREVFVSTLAVVVEGETDAEAEGVLDRLAVARRSDGGPLFTTANSWALLVYYVLAMQCLPTLAVTARESGSWKWALLQLAWMSGLAYALAAIVYQIAA
ncbi:MAG: ferrous iron transporter B [Phycisphaerales bacterium]